jgi:OOP family OmpA-OmpF porin
MTFKKVSETLGLLAAAAIISPAAIAADTYGYIGGNVGMSRGHFDEGRIATQVMPPASRVGAIDSDERDTGFKLFGGYQFHRNFALEGGYFDLGKFEFSGITIPPGTLTGNMRVRGLNLDLVASLPITPKFSAFGRVGANYANTKDSFTRTGTGTLVIANSRDRELNVKFGVGLQYKFSERLAMRAEAERYRVGDGVGSKANVDLFSVGLIYMFGGRSPEPVRRTAPPQPVAEPYVAPAPRPVIVAPPAPPEVVTPPAPPPPPPQQQEKPQRIDRN